MQNLLLNKSFYNPLNRKKLNIYYPSYQIYFQQTNMQNLMQKSAAAQAINQEEDNKIVVSKKKSGLLKKKKLPPTKLFSNVDLKHVVNIGDICFVNEQSIKHPDSSQETLLKTLYHYKMISKVTLNNSFVNIELKKNQDNHLPPEYFFERLRSFGDRQMANIATHLEKIHTQFQRIKQSCSVRQKTFVKASQEFMLQNFLRSMEGKKFFLYFSQITPEQINMRNIFFSIPLLKALGCNIKNIAMDFLKYKHVFFQVFTAKNYGNFMEICLQKFAKIQAQLMINPNMTQNQKKQLTSIIFDEQVIRKKQGPQGVYEQISRAKVQWFSPHPSLCCFQILDLQQAGGLGIRKKNKINHFQETKPEQEIQALRRIGVSNQFLQIQDQPYQNLAMALQKPPGILQKDPFKQSESIADVGHFC